MGFGTVIQPTLGPPQPAYSPPPPVLAATEPNAQPSQPQGFDDYYDDPNYPRRIPMVRKPCILNFQMYFDQSLRSKLVFLI